MFHESDEPQPVEPARDPLPIIGGALPVAGESAERSLRIIDRGASEAFAQTLEAQTNLCNAKTADRSLPDYLVLVEHDHVYTTGRGVPPTPVPARPGEDEVPWFEVGRGGQATYHGPGQLVAYPIFDLERHGKDVHLFLRSLERALVTMLARFGIASEPRTGLTGLWTRVPPQETDSDSGGADEIWKKIASIGIGVRRWVSYHGVALNVSTDLSRFREISPCGQDGAVMTSLEELCTLAGKAVPSMEQCKEALVEAFAESFKLDIDRPQRSESNGSADADDATGAAARPARPPWLRVRVPGGTQFSETNDLVRKLRLTTVCEEARCPNIGECWSHRTATFMIMGDLCTRRCSFCAVKDGTVGTLNPLDALEPYRVGVAVKELGLKHVVITSVNRDDVEDMGAVHFDKTVRSIASHSPDCKIELLIPDMRGRRSLVESILASGRVAVLNHNIETVPRLYRTVRPGASFKRSLDILRWAKEIQPDVKTKSGVMVGLGEQFEEVLEVMDSLRSAGCEILTIGQYLQPTAKQLPIERYVTPEEFAEYRREGLARGFSYVESGPLVRSSYHAWQHTAEDPAALPYVTTVG